MTIGSMMKSKVKFDISLKLYENENTTYLNIQDLMKTDLRENFLTLAPETKWSQYERSQIKNDKPKSLGKIRPNSVPK